MSGLFPFVLPPDRFQFLVRDQYHQRSDAHCTVSVRALLVPPLVQPTSPTFPLGVITLMLNCPGPEITPVVSVICSCWLEFTVGPRGFPLITISDAETKLLPLTLSS